MQFMAGVTTTPFAVAVATAHHQQKRQYGRMHVSRTPPLKTIDQGSVRRRRPVGIIGSLRSMQRASSA